MRNQGKRVSIIWIKGHNGNTGIDRADALAGRAAENTPQRTINSHQVSIAWMNQTVSQPYSEAATLELRDRGKHTIIPPPPKKSAMNKARNREARISSQLCTNHWLSGLYLKLIGKRAHAGCWFCEGRYDNVQPPTMTSHTFCFAALPSKMSGVKCGKIQLLVPSPGLDQLAPC
jgi:hypothetical protein